MNHIIIIMMIIIAKSYARQRRGPYTSRPVFMTIFSWRDASWWCPARARPLQRQWHKSPPVAIQQSRCPVHCNHRNQAEPCRGWHQWLIRFTSSYILTFWRVVLRCFSPVSAFCSLVSPPDSCSHYGVQTQIETPDVTAKQVSTQHQLRCLQRRQFVRPLHSVGHFTTCLNMLLGVLGIGRALRGAWRFVLVLCVATWDSAQLRCMTRGPAVPSHRSPLPDVKLPCSSQGRRERGAP